MKAELETRRAPRCHEHGDLLEDGACPTCDAERDVDDAADFYARQPEVRQ